MGVRYLQAITYLHSLLPVITNRISFHVLFCLSLVSFHEVIFPYHFCVPISCERSFPSCGKYQHSPNEGTILIVYLLVIIIHNVEEIKIMTSAHQKAGLESGFIDSCISWLQHNHLVRQHSVITTVGLPDLPWVPG